MPSLSEGTYTVPAGELWNVTYTYHMDQICGQTLESGTNPFPPGSTFDVTSVCYTPDYTEAFPCEACSTTYAVQYLSDEPGSPALITPADSTAAAWGVVAVFVVAFAARMLIKALQVDPD